MGWDGVLGAMESFFFCKITCGSVLSGGEWSLGFVLDSPSPDHNIKQKSPRLAFCISRPSSADHNPLQHLLIKIRKYVSLCFCCPVGGRLGLRFNVYLPTLHPANPIGTL